MTNALAYFIVGASEKEKKVFMTIDKEKKKKKMPHHGENFFFFLEFNFKEIFCKIMTHLNKTVFLYYLRTGKIN